MSYFSEFTRTIRSVLDELDTTERRSFWHAFLLALRHLRSHPQCNDEHDLEYFLFGYMAGWQRNSPALPRARSPPLYRLVGLTQHS